jgi:hypothetical protein
MGVKVNKELLVSNLDWITVDNVSIIYSNGVEEFFKSEIEGDLLVTFSQTQNLAVVKVGDDLYMYHNVEIVCEVL